MDPQKAWLYAYPYSGPGGADRPRPPTPMLTGRGHTWYDPSAWGSGITTGQMLQALGLRLVV